MSVQGKRNKQDREGQSETIMISNPFCRVDDESLDSLIMPRRNKSEKTESGLNITQLLLFFMALPVS